MWASGPWRDTEAHASPRNIHPQKSPRRIKLGGGFCDYLGDHTYSTKHECVDVARLPLRSHEVAQRLGDVRLTA